MARRKWQLKCLSNAMRKMDGVPVQFAPNSLDTCLTNQALASSGEGKLTSEYFAVGYQRWFKSTVRLLVSRGVAQEAALDTAQSAWTKGWERREQLRQPKALGTWVNSIALNIFRSELRRERATEELKDMPSSTGADSVIDAERLLGHCRANDRDVLSDHYFGGYAIHEIARRRNSSSMAIRIRLFRARRRLRDRVRAFKGEQFSTLRTQTNASIVGLPKSSS